jgi:succinoglycan biosynthesis protein ExoO
MDPAKVAGFALRLRPLLHSLSRCRVTVALSVSVSVVIPAYNAQDSIVRAVNSALAQTLPATEIIVVDDLSTDDTAAVVRAMARSDPRIRLVQQTANGGPSRSRNAAIGAATGEWIAILDADDAWAPYRLEIMLEAASRHQADIVADNQLLYDAVAETVTRTGFPVHRQTRVIRPIDVFQQEIKLGAEFSYGILKPIIRKSLLDQHHLQYNEHLRYGEDLLFLAEMLLSGAQAVLISDPLYIYTTRVGDRSGRPSPHSRSTPRYDLFADGVHALRSKYPAAISPDIDQAILRMVRRFRLERQANLARAARRERGMMAYTLHVLRCPEVLFQALARRVPMWARLLDRAQVASSSVDI